MAEQSVVIKIQADVSKATNDIKALQQIIAKLSTSGTQAASGTEKVSNAAKKTATASQLLDKEIKKVIAGQGNLERVAQLATKALEEEVAAAARLKDVSKAVEGAVGKKGAAVLGASKQIGGLADASGAASFALLSLGQAFQDSAQFGMGFAQGFRAINNNIQQTFTALALGSVQAGGFNNLLKLMGGSLWGPGGLILGFSALSAGIEFFATRAQRAAKDAEDIGKAFDEAANSIFAFQDSISGMSIKVPESAITPLREELERQIGAIDSLISDAGESLSSELGGAFKLAAINAAVLDPLTGSIAQGSADARENIFESAESDARILELRKKVDALDMDKIEGQRRLLSLLKQQEGFLEKRNELLQIAKDLGLDLTADEKKKNEAKIKGNLYLTESEKLLQDIADLNELIGSEEEKRVGQLNSQKELLGQLNKLNEEKAALELISSQLQAASLGPLAEGEANPLIYQQILQITNARDLNESLKDQIRLQLENLGLTDEQIDSLKLFGETAKDSLTKAEKSVAKLNLAFQQAAAQGLAQVSTGLIDMAINGTSFQQAILGPIADLAIQLGKTAISIGITMLELRDVFIKPGPAIAAGVALLAIGKAIKGRISASNATSRVASGGVSFGMPGLQEFNVGNLYGGTPGIGSAAGFPSLSVGSMAPSGMQIQLVARGPDLVSAVDAQRTANTRLIGGSR